MLFFFLTPILSQESGRLRLCLSTTAGRLAVLDSTRAALPGCWTHIAVVVAGAAATLYVGGRHDGRLQVC